MAYPLRETQSSALTGEPQPRLARLVEDQIRFVWRFLRHIGVSEHELDSAVEAVFAAAAERLPDVRIGRERSFLLSTSLHVAARFRREGGRRSDEATPNGVLALGELEPDSPSRAGLDGLLQQMALELRVVFVLSAIEGLSDTELADIVGIPLATVESRLVNAEEQFARHSRVDRGALRPLLLAAREERPAAVVLARALAAAGVHSSPAGDSRTDLAKPSSLASSVFPARRASPWKLSAKWLLMGLLFGLLMGSAVDALSDARERAASRSAPAPAP